MIWLAAGGRSGLWFNYLTTRLACGPVEKEMWPELLGPDGNIDRAKAAAAIQKTLGSVPADCADPDLDLRFHKMEDLETHVRYTLSFLSCGERIPAYLLIPKNAPKPWPAVLALHETDPSGKNHVVGLSGNLSLAYGLELVLRGFVVLAPDEMTAGQRVDKYGYYQTRGFYQKFPDWSALGRMLFDHGRALDVLEQVEGVDQARIGVIGHSLGGHNALFLAAFDSRVKATVASAAYELIETDLKKERWSREEYFVYAPRLREYVRPGSNKRAPWEFLHLLALIAPRPVFQSFALDDGIFTRPASPLLVRGEVESIYAADGNPGGLVTMLFNRTHSFPAWVREDAYRFLEHHLARRQE